MNRHRFFSAISAAGAVMLTVALAWAGLLWVAGQMNNAQPESPTPSGSPTPSASAEAAGVVIVDCRVSAAHYVQLAMGFTPDQYVVGKIDDTLPGAKANRGGAFSSVAVTTKDELREQLNSGTPEAKAVIADVKDQVEGPGPSTKQIKNTDNWVSVQYTVAVVWPENTTFVGGKAKNAGVLDNGKVGEVSWIYVSDAGCKLAKDTKVKTKKQVKAVVAQTASKRGACLNGKSHPVPADKYVPPTTTTPLPTTPPTTPPTDGPCVGVPKPNDGHRYVKAPPPDCWEKVEQTFDEQQNDESNPVRQAPQDNRTAEKNGVNTGSTIDTSTGEDIVEPEVRTPTDTQSEPTTTGSESTGQTAVTGSDSSGDASAPSNDSEPVEGAGDDNSGMPSGAP